MVYVNIKTTHAPVCIRIIRKYSQPLEKALNSIKKYPNNFPEIFPGVSRLKIRLSLMLSWTLTKVKFMINYDSIQTYPELVDILKHIDERIAASSCPPEYDIWTNKRLCEELNISVRTAAYLRSQKLLPYHKVNGMVFYLKSDVLAMLKQCRIESFRNRSKIKWMTLWNTS